ncbi:MAG: iron-dependent peroxidase [Clostridiaceae bacterium]|nr:iron-dependent peroxidase [Clostridiaceae bacterium]
MNYVWDIIIKARQLEIPEKNITFLLARSYSPYMELSNEDINFSDIDKEVEVNPYYRFFEIFRDMFDINYSWDIEFREVLFDITMHFLSEIDVIQGMSRREYYIRFIREDIERGIFGEEIAEGFCLFDKEEKYVLAQNILRLYITGEALYLFKDTVRRIFKNSTIYANYETKDELLFYIPYTENAINLAKIELLKELFLPIKFRTEIYWKEHFGIIGIDDTMRIDKIALY